ncbi:MAG: polysaccharide biosynthesis C-terminal domain-containing protein [Melioribacteraceae bacterium]|nr:polysaccharide biosynthesis C-terminal domain-containing protein [Melioribacteraceae bacterium]
MRDKLKQLSKETALYGISTVVGRFLNFLLVPFYSNVFLSGDFGIYANIYAYVAFFNIVYLYGMEAAYLKYASLEEGDSKKNIFVSTFYPLFLSSMIFSFAIVLFSSGLSDFWRIPAGLEYIVYCIAGILLFDTLTAIPFAHLRLQQKALKFSLIKIGNITINLTSNVIMIVVFDFGIEAIFLSNLIASLFSILLLIPEILVQLKARFNKEKFKKILKFGIPYLPASLSAIMVQVIDKPILMEIAGPEATGIYQANYKLGIFMMLFVSMFQYAWQPFFLNNAKEPNAKQIFSKVLTAFASISGIITVFLSLYIADIATLKFWGRSLIGADYHQGLVIVPLILLSYFFHGLYVNFTAGIYIEEKTKYLPLITFSGAVVNVITNFILIPQIGYLGAAIATLISYLVMCIYIYLISNKYYPIEYEFSKIVSIIIIVSTVITIDYILIYNDISTFLLQTCLFALFVGSLFITKILRKEDINLLFNRVIKK